MARPTKYNKDVTDKICFLIASTSKGLSKICEENGDLPTFKTVFNWLNDKDKVEFLQLYARAREAQADILADEIIEIADTELSTTARTECLNADGSFTSATTSDNHNRTRQMIDARKWKASKLAPKKYGDKLDVTSDGEKLSGYSVGFKRPESEG
jgi:terminase small subunit-like protein